MLSVFDLRDCTNSEKVDSGETCPLVKTRGIAAIKYQLAMDEYKAIQKQRRWTDT